MRRLLPLVLSLAIACGSDSPSQPTSASVAGTWNLQTINGTALPYVITQSDTTKVELVSDVVTAVATGSYTEITQVRTTVGGQVMNESFPDAGSFTLNGTAVVFQSNSDGSQTTGSVSGNTFTLAGDGFAYVYKRQ